MPTLFQLAEVAGWRPAGVGARVYGEQTVCAASGAPRATRLGSARSCRRLPPPPAGPAFLPLGLLSLNHRTLSDSDDSTRPPRAQPAHNPPSVVVTVLRGRRGYCPHRTVEETTAPAGGGIGWGWWAVSGGLVRPQLSVPGPGAHSFPDLPDKPGLPFTWVTTSSSPGPARPWVWTLPSEQAT